MAISTGDYAPVIGSRSDLYRRNGESRAPLPDQDIAAVDDDSDLLSIPK